MRMRLIKRIVVCGLSGSTLSSEKVIENKEACFYLLLPSETFLILKRIHRDIDMNVQIYLSKFLVILVSFE